MTYLDTLNLGIVSLLLFGISAQVLSSAFSAIRARDDESYRIAQRMLRIWGVVVLALAASVVVAFVHGALS